MNPIKHLIDKGWMTVNIKTVSGRKEEHHENIILNDTDFSPFDFGNIAIHSSSLRKISEDMDTVIFEGSFDIMPAYIPINEKVPEITRENSFVEVTITKV